MAVGDGGEGADKDGNNGAGTGNDLQGGVSDSDTLRDQKLGNDGVNAEVAGGVVISGGTEDNSDIISASQGRGMGMVIGGGGL